jgi:hypothetical protein
MEAQITAKCCYTVDKVIFLVLSKLTNHFYNDKSQFPLKPWRAWRKNLCGLRVKKKGFHAKFAMEAQRTAKCCYTVDKVIFLVLSKLTNHFYNDKS